MAERTSCTECGQSAVIVDEITDWPWCLDCALVVLRAGDPILEYRELAGGEAYTAELRRGTTETLPFG